MMRKNILRKVIIVTALIGGLNMGLAHAFNINGTFTGNWWEGPDKSGRGFLLEVTETDAGNVLIVNWFTFNDSGQQIWLNGNAVVDSGSNSVTVPLLRKEGGQFGPGFQAGQASDINWGEATFTFQSCDQGQVSYNGQDGSGTLEIQNLTRPQGTQCVVEEPFTACPAFASAGPVEGSCVLSGTITSDVTLTNNITWVLGGGVFIGGDNTNSATLHVEPGTTILGQGVSDFLYIRRGSKIIAQGTPQNPIIFTGPLEQSPGEWGGLVIAGNAPVNGCNEGVEFCEQVDEALTTPYGGNNPGESSGALKYVQIRYAGFEVRPDQELNGLTLLGVGSGTSIDYVQVHAGLDDGVEMFGGTVNLKHIVLTDIGDDSMDWGQGWQGKAQFVLIRQAADDGDRGIEADNNEDDFNSTPRSKPMISNITALGSAVSSNGALLRRGTGANIFNSVFTGFGEECLNIDSDATFTNAGTPASLTGELTIQNSYVNCGVNFADSGEDPFLVSDWFNAQAGNVAGNPQLDGYLPAEGSPLSTGGAPVADGFFDYTDFVGAFRNRYDDWTQGWTIALD
ncbi:hypothetical protein Nhal_3832 [Nitrosococcus halophilus Nc 4]|uniref:Lipoprotein n=1 Tax=Nitrosococcus halophilus (strain Nc4) TaxID=472759 RepID=D5C3D7_NITHN|nr:hypothetical protein [Nitrosococcus halophilus]ADE16844.1 hypothetical protein Nhal_3832 [Nitrosococcus halophilus Nc 4]